MLVCCVYPSSRISNLKMNQIDHRSGVKTLRCPAGGLWMVDGGAVAMTQRGGRRPARTAAGASSTRRRGHSATRWQQPRLRASKCECNDGSKEEKLRYVMQKVFVRTIISNQNILYILPIYDYSKVEVRESFVVFARNYIAAYCLAFKSELRLLRASWEVK